jgi:uncharacterized membrane-anchored protein
MLLEKLTKGQDLQLRLQNMVEGLSIAAISYCVVSLVFYGAKALNKLGLPFNPEVLAGVSTRLCFWERGKPCKRFMHEFNETSGGHLGSGEVS